jgi:16S rRNA (guanine527-N7)-methyltransferase
MTEEEARTWVRDRFDVSRETQISDFEALLRAEAQVQNLIAASTLDTVWTRHLTDSAQLVPLAAEAGKGAWIDIGSGAGLPGIVVAILVDRPVILVEPRRMRVDFLRSVGERLGLGNVTVHHGKMETYRVDAPAAIISARAVAALSQLLTSAIESADSSTVWVLPKGRNAESEVAEARRKWQGSFHVEPSVTQPDSGIVIAKGVRPR